MNLPRHCLPPACLLFLWAGPGRPQGPDAAKVSPVWTLTEGFLLPESAHYDSKSQRIYVSNMGSAPDARDGTGFISVLTPGGKIETLKWVTGLNAPKGIRSFENTLWVSSLDELIGIDVPTGKVVKRVKPNGAKFLNDVAVAKDGTVYVSDTVQSRIYSYDGRDARVFAEGDDAEWPNGLAIDGDRLVVAGWGKPEPDFSTKVPGRLFHFDLTTRKKTLITAKPTGNLVGVESDGHGGYIVTDSIAGKVLGVDRDGEVRTLLQGFKGPADFSYFPDRTLLILPRIGENAVSAFDLSKAR